MRAGAVALLALTLAACAEQGRTSFAPSAPQPQQQATILRPAPDPASLMHQPPQRIEAALGAPDFERRDGTARLWRYSAPKCTLLVVFYEEEGGLRSALLDARRPEGGKAAVDACLASVVNRPSA